MLDDEREDAFLKFASFLISFIIVLFVNEKKKRKNQLIHEFFIKLRKKLLFLFAETPIYYIS